MGLWGFLLFFFFPFAKIFKMTVSAQTSSLLLLWSECLGLPPLNSEAGILTPKVMVSGGGALQRRLGQKGGALTNGMCDLMTEAQ